MSITLNRKSVPTEHYDTGGCQHTWPLEVTASSSYDNIPSEIFVYHKGASDVEDSRDPYPGDRFECIASVHQLSTIPANDPEDPGDDSQNPFYRTDILFFHCLSLQDADELWEKIQDDVLDLISNVDAAENLTGDETVIIEVVEPVV